MIDAGSIVERQVRVRSGYVDIPEIVYPPKEKKGLLNALIGDIFQRSSLNNLISYPKPEYKIK